MNDKTRKILPLVGAVALTSSALLAGSGAALAGKPEPTIGYNGSGCTASAGDWRYFVTVDLSNNNGKWTFIESTFASDGGAQHQLPRRVETDFETVEFQSDGSPAVVTVTVVTRKGEATAASVTKSLTCPS